MQDKNTKIFSYMSRITFKEAPTSNSPSPTGRRIQPPSFLGSNLKEAPTPLVLRLQPEGSYNHQYLMLQPKGSSNSLILWNQLEGGYNPLSLPCLSTLKYKFQKTDETTTTLSL
jgi:hypothetical protein